MKYHHLPYIIAAVLVTVTALTYADNQPRVLASIRPLALLAEQIVGERGHVEVLLPSDASAHHYALKISDRQRLLAADTVLWIGEELEGFLAKPIAQRQAGVITSMHLEGIEWPDTSGRKGSREAHGSHHHGDRDPHIWLNPLNNIPIVNALLKELIQQAPANASYYQARAQRLKVALQQLDQVILEKMQPLQKVSFIVAHPAYDHFVNRYGLQQLDYIALTPERHAGAKHLYQLRQENIARCVFSDYGFPNKKASQLASDLNIPLLSLNPLGVPVVAMKSDEPSEGKGAKNINTLLALIEQLAEGFERCLSAKK
ncbi:MAG: zinc transport system substrate-binding protein [Kiritimatiellia bacterium]|jgi:zinc transport system substrate-binding protein